MKYRKIIKLIIITSFMILLTNSFSLNKLNAEDSKDPEVETVPAPEKPAPEVKDPAVPAPEVKDPVPQAPAIKSSNNNLYSLTLNKARINFNKDTLYYEVVVDHPVSSINVNALAESEAASVSGLGLKYLDLYDNSINITVTAEDGSSKTYLINVIREDILGNRRKLSDNNNLSALSVEGCELKFSPDILNYECEVDNLTENVKVLASIEEYLANYKINNIEPLELGDNLIEIIVTAENQEVKTYTVNVIRSKDVGIVDMFNLAKVLKVSEDDTIIVKSNLSGVISESLVEKIKESKKIIFIQQFKDDKSVLYEWKLDGSKISFKQAINTKISFDDKNKDKISELSDNAKGLILTFMENKTLPVNTEVRVDVRDDFKDNEVLNLYYYNQDKEKLELSASDLKVIDGFVTFELSHTSQYFLTSETLQTNSQLTPVLIGLIFIGLLLLAIFIQQYLKRSKQRRKNNVTYQDFEDEIEALDESEYSNISWNQDNQE